MYRAQEAEQVQSRARPAGTTLAEVLGRHQIDDPSDAEIDVLPEIYEVLRLIAEDAE